MRYFWPKPWTHLFPDFVVSPSFSIAAMTMAQAEAASTASTQRTAYPPTVDKDRTIPVIVSLAVVVCMFA